jgi:hypothetical protein
MKRFIIIITASFLIGISWGGFGNPAYAYEDTYEKAWDSGDIISNPVFDVAVGDTDGDGKSEIIAADFSLSGGAKVYVFENTGDNSYQLIWDSGTALTMRINRVAIGDQDSDGNLEIIVTETYDLLPQNAKVHVFENTGDNNYQEVWNSGSDLDGMGNTALFLGDADNDGKREILIGAGAHWSVCRLRVYENTGDNAYQEVWNSGNTTGDSVAEGAVADTDGDGKREIIVGSGGIERVVRVFETIGDNSYQLVTTISGFGKSPQAAIGDQDGDGNMEIIVGSHEGEWAVRVFEHNGSIEDNTYTEVSDSGTLDGRIYLPTIGDQDHDGKGEIVAPSVDGCKVYLFENSGDNDYQEVWNSGNVMSDFVGYAAVGDQDGDGKGEIIAACYDGKVYVFENLPPITTVVIDIKPGSWPNAINPRSKGVVPVAILTTDNFDAAAVDPLSVTFGPGEAAEAHGKGHIEDVDKDGDLDVVLHFKTQETGIQHGDTQACLKGKTIDGKSIEGCDTIVTVGKRKK